MTMRNFLTPSVRSLLIACALLPLSAMSQETTTSSQGQNESTVEGTVVSSTRDTLVVKTDDNQFQLFTFDRDTVKPRSLPAGTRVRVVSTAGEEAGVRLASTITMLEAAPSAKGTAQAQPIPPAVRDLERDIKRQADLIALNLEAIYRLPVSSRRGNWSAYLGAGPALTFLHQSFQSQAGQGRNIDFGNFDFDAGFNILTGVQFRRGTFFEVKTSLYSRPAPTLRLILGYNF